MEETKKKILIIEDDNMISSMYRAKFESDGYDIILAKDGANGLELAKKKMPDIILLDVILPQVDGFSVLQELKKDSKTKNIPVMMLTNLGTEEDKAKGEMYGVADYLVKAKFTPGQVSERVSKILKN